MGATRRAISAVLAEAGYPPNGDLSVRLEDAYRRISPNAGVSNMLQKMRGAGTRVVIFSNANKTMLDESVQAAGLADLVDGVFSVAPSRVFKPHPGAYSFLRSIWNKEATEVWLLSSNAWDIAGALAAGLRTCWWNKHGVSFPYGPLEPTRTVAALSDAPGEVVAEVG
ncbi:MAG: HAD-IA family hydrolase, partial [Planctomycetota bacterium]